MYVCALGLPVWCTFADSGAIKYSIISRYFRLCRFLNSVNYAWGFPQVTATWKNVFPNISPGLLSVLVFPSASAWVARMCKMKWSGVLLTEQHCCVHLAGGLTQQQAPRLHRSDVYALPHHLQVFIPELSSFIILWNHSWIWEFKPELTFITSLLFSWDCRNQIVMGHGVFCVLILW